MLQEQELCFSRQKIIASQTVEHSRAIYIMLNLEQPHRLEHFISEFD